MKSRQSNNFIFRFLFIILLIFSTSFVFFVNDNFAQDGDAGQPGEFLRYGVNARALAMGQAFTAVSDNANSVYWNPGGLFDIIRDGFSFSFMFSKLYESTSYNFAALAIPLELIVSSESESGIAGELKKWNLGFGYLSLTSDDFEGRDQNNQRTGKIFSDQQSAIYFSLTRSFAYKGHRFGIGANYKLLTHKLFDLQSNVPAIDLGLKFQPEFSWIEFGAVLQNMNKPDFAFTGRGEDIINPSVRFGFAFRPNTDKSIFKALLISTDIVVITPGKKDHDWYLGAEYDLAQLYNTVPIKLRFGINSRENFSFGINLDLPNSTFLKSNQVLPKLDWAYLSDDQTSLGGLAERFSVDFSYTPYTSQRWYSRGLQKFLDNKYQDAKEDFRRSIEAKNPGLTGYPASSALRLGDIEVFVSRDKLAGLKSALPFYRKGFSQDRPQIATDVEFNYKSANYYLQSLIHDKKYSQVVNLTTSETSWQDQPERFQSDPDVLSLTAWASFFIDDFDNAIYSAQESKGAVLCEFLLGLIYLNQQKYEEARNIFANITNKADYHIPDQIYVHPFKDNLVLDDAQFLYAYAGFKFFSQEGVLDARQLVELAQIQRYYPLSDMNKFLQDDNRFQSLIDMTYNNGRNVLDGIFQQYLNAIKKGSVSVASLIAEF